MTANAAERRPSRRFTHLAFGIGGRVASVVYGTVVAMATVTAAYATEKHPWKIAVVMWSTAIVLWIAHLYAHGLSASLSEGRRLGRRELLLIGGRESGILLAAVGPGVALILGAVGLLAERTAVWMALGVGLATLAAEGVRYARLERLGLTSTLAVTAANLGLGVLVVLLKVVVSH
jgi:hypothetical protein